MVFSSDESIFYRLGININVFRFRDLAMLNRTSKTDFGEIAYLMYVPVLKTRCVLDDDAY